jgi:hypothetical protein
MLDDAYKRFSLFAIVVSSNMAKFSLSFEFEENGCLWLSTTYPSCDNHKVLGPLKLTIVTVKVNQSESCILDLTTKRVVKK